ncbi:E3 ubiquitin-protein ligase PDZRN3-like [Mercenaria mercenaria]|uniref:E3 ubiquitin-protein ligase PDZRN3-like n=1 Tax=Mercenaria mercenaria TaxID=6596 RepID=UPI00234EECB9|nr:E3 ubiquitin-protein ligase PDZRN3-like [Mercenaria mercenaria]XP_053393075.1 E3 ubiquitin-protein ligase PDZRN3-like [Mercenaria mercenaria]XP_053393076.1 E3 ubiquitin-protein ligase PDZRN3-like [Mercenaria mercenaria]XP_053393077.1 E3 ubiquitin-protein ligase PDZRN3-like [Mercenaria mercenaria]
MGLDKELFEGEVGEEFLCGLCDQVLLNPVTAGCSHIFCQTCVNRKLRSLVSKSLCPSCSASLTSNTQDTTIEFKLKLLNLNLRCSHKCGANFVLADLPDHMDVCPNAPVKCEFKTKGCTRTVKRCDFKKHLEECDYRTVECEACGYVTLYRELFTHQSHVRCLEKKLKQQIIRERKLASKEINKHRERLFRDNVRLDQQQRKSLLNHSKSLKLKRKLRLPVNDETDPEFDYSPRDGIFLTEEAVQHHNDVTMEQNNEESKEATEQMQIQNNTKTPHSSRAGFSSQICSQCNKKFRSDTNTSTACRWHIGPVRGVLYHF